jgi:hypothetical protein
MYKQLHAPFGAFAMATLTFFSKERASNHTNDGTYNCRLRAELEFKADEKLGYPGPPGSLFIDIGWRRRFGWVPGTRILFVALRRPRSKFTTRTWKPTVEAHPADGKPVGADAARSVTSTASAGDGLEQQRKSGRVRSVCDSTTLYFRQRGFHATPC